MDRAYKLKKMADRLGISDEHLCGIIGCSTVNINEQRLDRLYKVVNIISSSYDLDGKQILLLLQNGRVGEHKIPLVYFVCIFAEIFAELEDIGWGKAVKEAYDDFFKDNKNIGVNILNLIGFLALIINLLLFVFR